MDESSLASETHKASHVYSSVDKEVTNTSEVILGYPVPTSWLCYVDIYYEAKKEPMQISTVERMPNNCHSKSLIMGSYSGKLFGSFL